MQQIKKLEESVASWPEISVHPHRFAAREFRFGNAEVEHVHSNGIVDIPFHGPFAMLFLRKGSPRSINGFPIQGGLHFGSEATKTYSTQYGSCGCLIFAMR
jgi:hypothetical protein